MAQNRTAEEMASRSPTKWAPAEPTTNRPIATGIVAPITIPAGHPKPHKHACATFWQAQAESYYSLYSQEIFSAG